MRWVTGSRSRSSRTGLKRSASMIASWGRCHRELAEPLPAPGPHRDTARSSIANRQRRDDGKFANKTGLSDKGTTTPPVPFPRREPPERPPRNNIGWDAMDKDRVAGTGKQLKGSIKETAG